MTSETTTTTFHDWAIGEGRRERPYLICALCAKQLGARTKASEWKAVFYSPCPGLPHDAQRPHGSV